MKKFILFLFILVITSCGLFSQTINPKQIRPSATSGQVLTTTTGGMPPSWQPPTASPPASPSLAIQFSNSGVTAFQADTTTVYGGGSALSYNPTTHTQGLNFLNGLGFISPHQTSGGDGQTAYFGSGTNQLGVLDNLELTGDALFPAGNGNMVLDVNSHLGHFGIRSNNCVTDNGAIESSFGTPNGFCTGFLSNDTTIGPAPRDLLFLGGQTTGQGKDNGPYGPYTPADQGWTNTGFGSSIDVNSSRPGIKAGVILTLNCIGEGDCNGFRVYSNYGGNNTTSADEAYSAYTDNVVDGGSTTATVASIPVSGQPTYSGVTGALFQPAGMVADTTAASISGSITGIGTRWSTTGVTAMNFITGGLGQTLSVTYHLTGVGNSVGANATYTTSTTVSGSLTGVYVCIQNFGTATNNGCFLTVSNTTSSITVANANAVAEANTFTIAITQFTIACSSSFGGSGFIAVDGVGGAGGVVGTQPTILNPGFGYTAAPTGCSLQGAGGTAATFEAHITTPIQTIPTSGISLTPFTGECINTSYVPGASLPNPQTNISSSLSCVAQTSGGITTGSAWFITAAKPEFVQVTAATTPDPTTKIQTLTISSHLPHEALGVLIQGANFPECLWFDANATGYGHTNPWPVCYLLFGASDSSHMLAGFVVTGGMDGNFIPQVGNEAEGITSPNNTFHGYRAAVINYISPNSAQPVLGYNTVPWTNGDSIVGVPNPAFALKTFGANAFINTPTNGRQSQMWSSQISGNAATSAYLDHNFGNGNNFAEYKGCGPTSNQFVCVPDSGSDQGILGGPTEYRIYGAWDTMFNAAFPPLPGRYVWHVQDNNLGGVYNYIYLGTESVGNLVVDQIDNAFQFTNNILVEGVGTIHALSLQNLSNPANTVFEEVLGNPAAVGGQSVYFSQGVFTLDSSASLSAAGYTGANHYVGAKPSSIGQVTPNGITGSTVYCYQAADVTSNGQSVPSAVFCTSTGSATLSSSNFNLVKNNFAEGTQYSRIYRVSAMGGSGVQGLICDNVLNEPNASCNDIGQTPSITGPPPTTDTSGALYVGGPITASSLPASTSPICPNGTSGALTTTGCVFLPSGTTNQLLYYATGGTTVVPLTLGSNLSISSGILNAAPAFATPSSSSAACTVPAFTYDASFVYVCTASNTWKRSALSTF